MDSFRIALKPVRRSLPAPVIASRAAAATGFLARLAGLMFRKSFGGIDALILAPCRAVHTFFMRFPIDVICLDDAYEVCDTAESLPPGKIFIPAAPTSTVIEVPRGTIRRFGLMRGDALVLLITGSRNKVAFSNWIFL